MVFAGFLAGNAVLETDGSNRDCQVTGKLLAGPVVDKDLGCPHVADNGSMLNLSERKLLGFVDLDLGGMAVRVPVLADEHQPPVGVPLVSLECEGRTCEIIVRGDTSSQEVGREMREVAEQAVRHLSGKLLN